MSKLFTHRSLVGSLLRLLLVLTFVATSFAFVGSAGAAPGGQGKGNGKISLGPVAQKAKPIKPAGKIAKPPNVKRVDPKLARANATDPIDLKVLVVVVPGDDWDRAMIKATLDQLGTPYTIFDASTQTLTSSTLWDGALHGYYQGIILTRGDLGYSSGGAYVSGFTTDEWAALQDYENRFAIRQVTLETSPSYPAGSPFNYGLTQIGSGNGPLKGTLTTTGRTAFSYLVATNTITVDRWSYYSTIADTANVTSLLSAPCGTSQTCALASIVNYPGTARQNLTLTFGQNTSYLPSTLLSYGVVNWVTKGLFLGERHVNFNYQVDDYFEPDDIWDPALLMDTGNASYPTNGTVKPSRMTAADLIALVNWQKGIENDNYFYNLMLEFAFNGEGTVNYTPDDLTPATKTNQLLFNWVNHTYTHVNLDSITSAATTTELKKNNQVAINLPLDPYSKKSLVQPDISGLNNPNFLSAAYTFGIRYLVSDTSQPNWRNPSPNAGYYSKYQPGILIIPRHPTNLFYNLITPAQWVSEFNCYYSQVTNDPTTGLDRVQACTMTFADGTHQTRQFATDLTYSQILDKESDWLLSYLLTWDLDPVMFHVPNAQTYDGTHSLLGDLISATMVKYDKVYKLPVRNLTQTGVGTQMAQRMAYNASGATASLVPCAAGVTTTTMSVTVAKAASIPVTGPVTAGYTSTAKYGGQSISWVTANPGTPVTMTVACPLK